MPHTALAIADITDSAVHWRRDGLEDMAPRRVRDFPRPEMRRARLPRMRPGPVLRTLEQTYTAHHDSTGCRPPQTIGRLTPGPARG